MAFARRAARSSLRAFCLLWGLRVAGFSVGVGMVGPWGAVRAYDENSIVVSEPTFTPSPQHTCPEHGLPAYMVGEFFSVTESAYIGSTSYGLGQLRTYTVHHEIEDGVGNWARGEDRRITWEPWAEGTQRSGISASNTPVHTFTEADVGQHRAQSVGIANWGRMSVGRDYCVIPPPAPEALVSDALLEEALISF